MSQFEPMSVTVIVAANWHCEVNHRPRSDRCHPAYRLQLTEIVIIRYGKRQNMKRPNIVLLFADQQRWDTCGCYGQSLDITPNLDRMADEGVRFENAFTCQPVCGPARASADVPSEQSNGNTAFARPTNRQMIRPVMFMSRNFCMS
jgi:hypothetical protein